MAGWGRTKPPPGAGIAWGHPLADRLLWAVAPGPDNTKDLIDGQQGTILNTSTLTGQTPIGQALDSPDTTNGGMSWPWTDRLLGLTTKWTVLVWAVPMADGFSHFLDIPYRSTGWTTPFQGLGFAYDNTSDRLFQNYAEHASSSIQANSGSSTLTAMGLTDLAQWVVTRDETTVKFYRNAVQIGTDQTLPSNPVVDLSGKQPVVLLGRSSTSLGESLQGRSPLAAIWSRALRQDELARMVVEPYAFILPPRRLYIPDVSVTAIVTSDSGSGTEAATINTAAYVTTETGSGADTFTAGGGITYQSEVLADSPTMVMPMDEASGNLASLVNGHVGTKVGSPTYGVSGPIPGHTAIQFTNAADYFTVADHANLDLGDGPFTLECWAARDTDTGAYAIAFNKGVTAYTFGITNLDKWQLGKRGITTLFASSGSISADSSWHHYVVTRSAAGAGNTKVFVDAVDVSAAVDTATTLADTAAVLEIGQEGAANSLAGRLAWIAIYKTVLSAGRITAHFAAGVTVKNGVDSGSGAEAATIVSPAYAAVDSGSGADTSTTTTAVLTAAEAGAGADVVSVLGVSGISDSAAGVDTVLVLDTAGTIAVLTTEAGSGSEAAAIETATLLGAAESAAGTEATTTRAIMSDDAASGTETVTATTAAILAAETAVGADVTIAVGVGGPLSLQQEVLADSPSFLLWFDAVSGNLTDAIGGLVATVSGAPTYGEASPIPGRTAVRFPAATAFFTVVSAAALNLGAGPFTIEVIARRDNDTGSYSGILNKGATGYSAGWTATDKWQLGKSGTGSMAEESATTPASTAWLHYVTTFNGASTGTVYRDAANVSVISSVNVPADTALALEIGREGAGFPSAGSLAMVAIYKSILSPARITAHFGAIGNVGNRAVLTSEVSQPLVEDYTEVASIGPDEIGVGVDVVTELVKAAVPVILNLFGTDGGVGSETAIATAFSVAATGRPVEYVMEIFDSGGTFGPGTRLGEVWDARNVGWSTYDRLPGKAFATLYQGSPALSLMVPLTTHVKLWRLSSNATTNVYSGAFFDYDASGDDVVLNCFDYLALLSISRTGYKTMYPQKTLKEIVDAEWALGQAATSSPLAFLTTGTSETPLGTDGLTAIKTNNQFGLLDQMRLQLFYDLTEIGRANTNNHVTYGISRTAPHTFTFRKDAGTAIQMGLVLGGNVSDYRHLPNWAAYRNDLATIGTTVGGGATEIVVTDPAETTLKGRRQDVTTIKTILGIVGKATEADSQKAAAERMLRVATDQSPVLMLRLLHGALEPFVGWEINDRAPIEIGIGIPNSITVPYRIVGARGMVTEAGEDLSLILEPVLT